MESLEKNNIEVTNEIILLTLREIEKAGKENCEKLVLWLGKNTSDGDSVVALLVPEQINDYGYFELPRSSMASILSYLRENHLKIIAQVHSHPEKAFHSDADNRWAIIRHEGALSIVIPYFGSRTNLANFFNEVAVFTLSASNYWMKLTRVEISNQFKTIE